MIQKLSVKNFKSIKELQIDCRRINVFIGEPNTGKSNILEALGLLSWFGHGNVNLKEYVRFQYMQNLFYDDILNKQVEIKIENMEMGMRVKFENDSFHFYFEELSEGDKKVLGKRNLNYSGEPTGRPRGPVSELTFMKFYRFKQHNTFPEKKSSFLMPPHGRNMFALLMADKKLRDIVSQFFKKSGFSIVLKPKERVFELQKQMDDIISSHPYILASDTLQRVIFHALAIESNTNSTLVLEEPESYAFPYYTKHLGERMAFDRTNQYFVATHNPYLLRPILEKAAKSDLAVYLTYFRDYETKVKCLNDVEVSKLAAYEPFADLGFLAAGE